MRAAHGAGPGERGNGPAREVSRAGRREASARVGLRAQRVAWASLGCAHWLGWSGAGWQGKGPS